MVRVIDADTYEVLSTAGRQHVRLLHLDAPERDQPFGLQAIDSVRMLLPAGRLVELRRSGRVDRYGRILGTVHLIWKGRMVALDSVLVARGWAWAYAPGGERSRREAEQQRAQTYGRGLWKCGAGEPVPPHLWRGFNKRNKRLCWGGCTW